MIKQKTAEEIWREYQKAIDFNRSIDLYDNVKTNENFFLGRQWEGLSVKTLDPLIFNVLRRVVNLFISMLVSDDVAVSARPFDMDERGRLAEKVLDKAFISAMERSKMKVKNRYMLRNACVDGDGCFYIHFDPDIETGQPVKGDIAVEVIDNTNVYFGNTAVDEVQRQPYIIISMRRDVDEVRAEAKRNGVPENEISTIVPDSQMEQLYDENLEDNKVTVLLRMFRHQSMVYFQKTTASAVVMPMKKSGYKLYPIVYMSWDRVKNCYHGASPVTEAIPNQIAINKLYSMYVQCVKQVAFPKIIYDMTRFPNGYSNDVGKAVAMRGNPNEAILTAFKAPDISAHVMTVLQQMIKDTMELMGASDAALGNVSPNNTSAIVTVQKATIAPLELVKMEFYRFVEDSVRVFLELMSVHYGMRTVFVTNDDGEEERVSFDFSSLSDIGMQLNVEVGSSAYWSETMQTVTNDNLLEKGIITDPVVYVENIPDNQIRGKNRLLRSLKAQKNAQKTFDIKA